MDHPVEYDAFADIYDVWTETAPVAGLNLHFYVEEYLRTPAPVVELGIGNGRIALEAVLQGKPMVGVDSSRQMLRLCRERAQAAGVAHLLTLIQADFRDFRLPEPAQLITIPFHTIGHLLTLEDKEAALRHIYSQLAPGGRLIFDTFVFSPEFAQARNNVATLRAEYVDPKTGQDVLLWVASSYQFKTQTMRVITWTDELDEKGVVVQHRYRFLSFSWIEPEQVRALLQETGYQVETVYGDFERHPLGQGSPEQIWVARKA
jgi:ubiquinone/menaquinone biosynthesis C-methylase UbiE